MFLLATKAYPQISESLSKQVSVALETRQWRDAIELFSLLVEKDVEEAEIVYWIEVDKSSASSSEMVWRMATHHHASHNYEKAYLFYKQLAVKHPDSIRYLGYQAEMELLVGKEWDALRTYERIILLDPDHLVANIYAGNYHYLRAERLREDIERQFGRIENPNRMQQARYRDDLEALYKNNYAKAKLHLQNVVKQFSSVGAKELLKQIEELEKEIYS